jgi:hypothetical protein
VPARSPILILARCAAVPGDLALRANLEVLQRAHNLAPVVVAILIPHQRLSANFVEHSEWITLPCNAPLPQPIYNAGQDIRGDFVTFHDPSRRGDPGGFPHVPNLAGVGEVHDMEWASFKRAMA